jgi:hypothetical protein
VAEAVNYQVFLSYHEADVYAAEEIALRLQKHHAIKPWLLAWSVSPGRITQEAQEEGLAQSNACAMLVGKAGTQGWQRMDAYAAIRQRVETEGSDFPVIPVYLPDLPATARAAVPSMLRLYEPVTFLTLDDDEALRRLVCGIHGEPPEKTIPTDLPCPYPGLEPFGEDLASYFFGREDEIRQLQELLAERAFVVVIGPSGSGKSSLALAGLIPRLRGTATNPSPFLVRTLTPGSEPLQSLAMAFVPQPGDLRRNNLASAMQADERELARTIKAELQQQPSPVRHRERQEVGEAAETGRNCGYQPRNTSSRSPSSTLVRVCNSRCAPFCDHCICCRLTNRLLTT